MLVGLVPQQMPDRLGLALRLGLGRPLRQHRRPSQKTGPPAHISAAGQRALPRLQHYYEPSDSSESIGLPFPIQGYSFAYPTSTDPPNTGPHMVNRVALPGPDVVCEDNTGPYEVSHDHFVSNVATTRRHNHPKPPPPQSFHGMR